MAKLLLHPDSDIEFQASPAMILGPFDVYDREESLGQDLNAYDPNDNAQLRLLFERHLLTALANKGWTAAHRAALTQALAATLQDPQYPFVALLEDDEEHGFYLPSNWNIQAPRQFFHQAYLTLLEHWGHAISAPPPG
ncbi:Dehydrogenase [Comamonas aquatilis]|uniref:hypothetical protein n=1 Tax=Comamonas aquatilis TaxID=1778406 RepID=UPI0039EEC162